MIIPKNLRNLINKVKLLFVDGKNMDFPDNCFDIVFRNAVVEHVGGRREKTIYS